MNKPSKIIAVCGMLTALGVVIMLLGHVLGLGLYLSPMIVGLSLVPVGNRCGKKYHLLLWGAISLLCALFGINPEQTLLFFALFGLYPIIFPYFYRLPRFWRVCAKLLYFNAVTVAVESLVLKVLAPEAVAPMLLGLLLFLGNVLFICFDFVIPHTELLLKNLRKRFTKR